MNNRLLYFRPFLLATCLQLINVTVWADSSGPETTIDWSAFLAQQDLVWTRNPADWGDSVFIGNGNLGATVFTKNGAVGWEINRADVTYGGSRYPIGHLALKTAGKITGGDAHLNLWDAEGSGTVITNQGSIHWRTFVATTPSVIVIELDGKDGEIACDLDWRPASARPPRKVFRKEPFTNEDLHPDAIVTRKDEETTSIQTFLNGGAHAESILTTKESDGKKLYYISIGFGLTGDQALAEASAITQAATQLGLDKLTETHQAWWHAYYPESFLSIPDARLEAFYWIQVYKLGSAMRDDGPILDLMGPWFAPSPWDKIWCNLNLQLTYLPLLTANRLPQMESLFGALDRHRQQLIDNVPPNLRDQAAAIGRAASYDLVAPVNAAQAFETKKDVEMGNLPWVLYLYWVYYRCQMDDTILRDRVLPLLKLTIGHYLAFVQKDDQGHWHLPPTYSPEFATAPDCNYDLALLKWGLQTLIESSEHLHIDDPLLPHWRDVLANLTPFPTDASGLMIGSGMPLHESQRHYSHLLAIYPLHLLDPDQPEDRTLIQTSFQNWVSTPEKLKGFSYTGAASINALLGNGDAALDDLNKLLDTFIKPNTLYAESGPCIETPLSAASSLQEMLLQSWGGTIRVFPAIPKAWNDVSFYDLRAEGAFLVSAVRGGGKTVWIRIESLAGEPCHIRIPDWKDVVVCASTGAEPHLTMESPGNFTLELAKGATVVLSETATSSLPPLAPVVTPEDGHNPYPMRYK